MVVAGQAQYQIVKQACQLGLAPNANTKLLGSTGLLQKEVWEVDGECGKDLLVINIATPKSNSTIRPRRSSAAFQKHYDRAPDRRGHGSLRHARRGCRRRSSRQSRLIARPSSRRSRPSTTSGRERHLPFLDRPSSRHGRFISSWTCRSYHPVHQREPGARRCADRLSEGMGDDRQARSVSWRIDDRLLSAHFSSRVKRRP